MRRRREHSERELRNFEKVLTDERNEVAEIEQEIRLLEEKLLEKRPSHFSKRDVINALFASLIFGFTIVLRGGVESLVKALTPIHIIAIIIATSIILYLEIYYVGYTRVRPEEHRKLGQFVAKRFFTFYGASLLVALALIYLFGVNELLANFQEIMKMVILVSMPCAIGAAIPSMLKQF